MKCMKNMNNSNMIQCPNCKTWNNYNSEFCTNCGSRLTAFAGEWWKGYNMEPVDFSKVQRGYWIVFFSSCYFVFFSLVCLGSAIVYCIDSKPILNIIALGGLFLILSALSIVLFRWGRKEKRKFRSIDYVEIPQRKNWLQIKFAGGPNYIFVMSGTYASHKFGLLSARGWICLPIIYDSLKWQEKGKTLLAVLNGVPMIIDVKGRRYE